eukprot:TRINITY_DN16832_c0_g3_i1.p1 TRINITY_DN16832_c0_g3~~TRINITY_DN16832_c0_g3_i1.p1  ORF type:complete len:526 (+),score=71.76 TRINITY_DN16832_c0_g3_i1:148-1578(+)
MGETVLAPLESPTGKAYPPKTSIELRGNMEPVTQEVSGSLECIFGALPHDIDGQFIRTGPNPRMDSDGKPYHAFNGDGMLHAIDMKNGAATYKNRWIQTKRVELEAEKGRPLKMQESMDSDGLFLGMANTSVAYHAKKLLALYEADRPYAVSLPDLATLGVETYAGKLDHSFTAHPKICPKTGEMVFFGYALAQPAVHYAVAGKDGQLLRSFEVPTKCGKPVMMHDMAITPNYSILLEFPLCFEMSRVAAGAMPYAMDKTKPSSFGILPRHAKSHEEVRWFEGRTMYAFHIATAWEEGDIVKLVGTPNPDFDFEFERSGTSVIYEWAFNLKDGTLEERQLDCNTKLGDVEFPVIPQRYVGSAVKYVYTAQFTKKTGGEYSPFHAIRGCNKHDLKTGTVKTHVFKDGRWGGESVFVPNGPGEDDGYLITYTFNPEDKTSEVYIVDSKTMDPDPIAILRTPQRVPFGFHGMWLPRSEM